MIRLLIARWRLRRMSRQAQALLGVVPPPTRARKTCACGGDCACGKKKGGKK